MNITCRKSDRKKYQKVVIATEKRVNLNPKAIMVTRPEKC